MKIEDVWRELESEATRTSGKWLTRLARPDPGTLLLVAVDGETGARTLLLPCSPDSLPPRGRWPVTNGLDVFRIALDGIEYVAVRLRDSSASAVFSALGQDIAERVSLQSTPAGALATALERIRRWQQFLSASTELSPEAQRGLWAELHVLLNHLIPAVGAVAAAEAWQAASGAHQDFRFAGGAIEAKCTAGKPPPRVRVTSERQLDDCGVGLLFLHVVIVDERDVPSTPEVSGSTLPDIIEATRRAVSDDSAARALLDDRLLEAGWLDIRSPLYSSRRWAVRQELSFAVTDGFPRLTEKSLPTGIGSVSYELDLGSCADFSITTNRMISLIASLKG